MDTEEAVLYFGTKEEVARVLGVTGRTVREWGPTIPRRRSYALRKAMESHPGKFDEVAELEKVKANIEREAARKLKAVDRMISSIKEGQDDE
jgi:hypothetical protein